MDLVGVQEVRWEVIGTLESGNYTLFYVEGNANHQLGTGILFMRKLAQQLKGWNLLMTMFHVLLKGRWCHIIALNVHAPSEDKDDDIKDSFYEEMERLFNQLPMYHMKILLGDFNAIVGR